LPYIIEIQEKKFWYNTKEYKEYSNWFLQRVFNILTNEKILKKLKDADIIIDITKKQVDLSLFNNPSEIKIKWQNLEKLLEYTYTKSNIYEPEWFWLTSKKDLKKFLVNFFKYFDFKVNVRKNKPYFN
jgi:hypothetical protein